MFYVVEIFLDVLLVGESVDVQLYTWHGFWWHSATVHKEAFSWSSVVSTSEIVQKTKDTLFTESPRKFRFHVWVTILQFPRDNQHYLEPLRWKTWLCYHRYCFCIVYVLSVHYHQSVLLLSSYVSSGNFNELNSYDEVSRQICICLQLLRLWRQTW